MEVETRDYTVFCWRRLEEIFGKCAKPRPPLYLFLSKASSGTLFRRRTEEINFVHAIQAAGGGVTLADPPLAYVSAWYQVPEETAHLYAVCRKKMGSQPSREYFVIQEAFAKFFELLVQRERQKDPVIKLEREWDRIHREGYALGRAWAKAHYLGKLKSQDYRLWMNLSWHAASSLKKLAKRIRK